MKKRSISLMAAACFAIFSGSVMAEDLDAAIERLDALADSWESIQLVQRTTMIAEYGSQVIDSTTISKNQNGNRLFRSSVTMETKMQMGEGPDAPLMESLGKILTIADGTFMWSDVTQDDQRQVTKMPYDPTEEDSVRSVLIPGAEHALLEKSEMNGETLTVIETSIPDTPGARLQLMFSDVTGVLMGLQMIGHPMGSSKMETLSVTVNPELAEDTFVFTPPEGVPVREIPGM